MNLENIKNHKLQSILLFSIPAIIGMVLTSLITVVDGFFIGNYVGAAGIAAVNLGLPIIYLYLAVGLMISVGGVAIAGMALGAGKLENCNSIFNQTLITTSVASIILSVLVFFCLEPMLNILNATTQVAVHFKEYYQIMLFQLPIMVINASFGMFIRSEGNPRYYMNVNIIYVLLNILLDYIFVKYCHFGVTGVAVASLISALVASLCIIYFFIKKSKVYKFEKFIFSKEVFKNTFLNGSSEFIGEISLSISMFAYNFVIMKYIGVDGVTAFAIAGYVAYIFSMIIIGFGQGSSPLISYTYGAKEYVLAINLRKITNVLVFIAGIVVCILIFISANWYSGFFIKNEFIEKMISFGIKIFALSFLFSGINTITSFYFTSIGKALESAIISFARGLFILLICIFTLPVLWGMTGVWLVAPITEAITILISIFFMSKEHRKIIWQS